MMFTLGEFEAILNNRVAYDDIAGQFKLAVDMYNVLVNEDKQADELADIITLLNADKCLAFWCRHGLVVPEGIWDIVGARKFVSDWYGRCLCAVLHRFGVRGLVPRYNSARDVIDFYTGGALVLPGRWWLRWPYFVSEEDLRDVVMPYISNRHNTGRVVT